MRMLGGFSQSKLKPHLKMAVSRFQIASNKKTALMKQQMREIAKLLAEEPTPKEEKAKIRAESLIREDNTVEAYEILQLECELLAERIKLLSSQKECPKDLVSCISTIIWAADRVDIPELLEIRKQFRLKYGKKFEEDAINNVGGVLNERVVAKLSVQPPSAYLVQTYLEKIAEEHNISWSPRVRVTADSMSEPMAAPIGYSVPIGGGTGLGQVLTGQQDIDDEIRYIPPPPSGKADPNVPSAVATPYIPPVPPPAQGGGGGGVDFEEPDIFIPSAPTTGTKTNGLDGSHGGGGGGGNDDDSDENGGGASSYDDLAARFSALKK